ncbi:MAG: nucleotidyltransferase family protein [Candidatus Micrarchaeota archaeon]|nr:nucleotidyltransferase family protein [Candidatus Micrarchaeota archaeon]
MDALILCGGFATRLEPITLFVPKPLLPIGGRPIVDYIIENVANIDEINSIVFSTNQKFYDQFEYWLEHKKANGVTNKIKLVVEPAMHEGEKFGAVKGISYTIEKAKLKDDLMIIAGDNFYNFKLDKMLSYFKKTRKPTIALHNIKSREEARRFGVVALDGDRVTGFEEKPQNPKSTLISTGIYIFPKESLGLFKEYVSDGNNPDAPGYFMQWLLKGTEVKGVVHDEEWFDIGTLETYSEVFNKYLKEHND